MFAQFVIHETFLWIGLDAFLCISNRMIGICRGGGGYYIEYSGVYAATQLIMASFLYFVVHSIHTSGLRSLMRCCER